MCLLSINKIPKVQVVTIERMYLLSNYGSFFQHYALRKILKSWGYATSYKDEGSRVQLIKQWMSPLVTVKNLVICALRRKSSEAVYRSYISDVFRSIKFYREFERYCGPVFERPSKAGVYIAGSDQVWGNLRRSSYLLDVPEKAKKIAYAASSNWGKIKSNIEWRKLIELALDRINAVSVREDQGVDICNQIKPGCGVVKCVDPVLLLKRSDYEEIIGPASRDKRSAMLCYLVRKVEDADTLENELLTIAREKGIGIKYVGIQGAAKTFERIKEINPSPTSFIRAVRDSKCIVTNSFHGLAFSILFNKPFVFLNQSEVATSAGNDRQFNLLNICGIADRCITKIDACRMREILSKDVNWDLVNEKIEKVRGFSKSWLKEALDK